MKDLPSEVRRFLSISFKSLFNWSNISLIFIPLLLAISCVIPFILQAIEVLSIIKLLGFIILCYLIRSILIILLGFLINLIILYIILLLVF